MSALVSAYSVPRTMPGIQTKVGIPFLYMDSFNPHHDYYLCMQQQHGIHYDKMTSLIRIKHTVLNLKSISM